MRVLVTGGAGFIGSNLVRKLLVDGHDVVVIDDLSTGRAANLMGLDADCKIGSILDDAVLERAMKRVDSIVHLAAIPSVPRSVLAPTPSHEANVTGTLRVLEAARDVGAHVTVASSSSVYGANPRMPKVEKMTPRPVSPYAASKLAAESYTVAWHLTYGLEAIAFRFFNVYGPGQLAGHAYAAVIPSFIDAALREQPLNIQGDGLQSRDFTFVDSVISVLVLSCTSRTASETPVNLAFGSRRTLLEVVETLEDTLQRPLVRRHSQPRVGDVRDSQADNTRLLQLFPDAVPTPFVEGLARTVKWMADELNERA